MDDQDTFPKNCAVCGKTSRGVPSVACDFCPLVYHLDCLDPPMCEPPSVSTYYFLWEIGFILYSKFKQRVQHVCYLFEKSIKLHSTHNYRHTCTNLQ